MRIKSLVITAVLTTAILCSATAVSAAGLTQPQIDSILGLLRSFGADSNTISNVQISLNGGTPKGVLRKAGLQPGDSITITSPIGGETWKVGETHNITWAPAGLTGNISIWRGPSTGVFASGAVAIATVPASSDSYAWLVDQGALGSDIIKLVSDTGSQSLSNAFTVSPASGTIVGGISVLPNYGTTDGGTTITITGTGFASDAIVRVGANPSFIDDPRATNVVVNSSGTRITATTPPSSMIISPNGMIGGAAVSVTNPNNQSSSVSYGAFTYVSPNGIITQATCPSGMTWNVSNRACTGGTFPCSVGNWDSTLNTCSTYSICPSGKTLISLLNECFSNPPATSFSVSLSLSSPTAGNIYMNEARNIAKFTVSNPTASDKTITELAFKKIGNADSAILSYSKLYVGTQVAADQPTQISAGEGKIIYRNISIVVSANSSVEVAVDVKPMSSDGDFIGKTIGLSLNSSSDIIAGAAIGGSFPVSGKLMTVADSLISRPVVNISALPSVITAGQSSTLTWSTSNATYCSASGGWSGAQPASGTQTVRPTADTSYILTCTNSSGYSSSATALVSMTSHARSLTLAAPNGNEDWKIGSTHYIVWTSTNFTGTSNDPVVLTLKDAITNRTYSINANQNTAVSFNMYSWTIPSTIPTGSYFKITATVGEASDASDNFFKISAADTQPINGQCKTPTAAILSKTTQVASDYCAAGTYGNYGATSGNNIIWDCLGIRNGATAHCSAPKPVVAVRGVCGTANGKDYLNEPLANAKCLTGNPITAVTEVGFFTWKCQGANGGSDSEVCKATRTGSNTPIVGFCGEANGQSSSTAPTVDKRCGTGTVSGFQENASGWTWQCVGLSGGATVNCRATKAAPILTNLSTDKNSYKRGEQVKLNWYSSNIQKVLIIWTKYESATYSGSKFGWVTHPELTTQTGHSVDNANSFTWMIPTSVSDIPDGQYVVQVFIYDPNAGGTGAGSVTKTSNIFTISGAVSSNSPSSSQNAWASLFDAIANLFKK